VLLDVPSLRGVTTWHVLPGERATVSHLLLHHLVSLRLAQIAIPAMVALLAGAHTQVWTYRRQLTVLAHRGLHDLFDLARSHAMRRLHLASAWMGKTASWWGQSTIFGLLLLVTENLDILFHQGSIGSAENITFFEVLLLDTQESLSVKIFITHKRIQVTKIIIPQTILTSRFRKFLEKSLAFLAESEPTE